MATSDDLLTRIRDQADHDAYASIVRRVYRGRNELMRMGLDPKAPNYGVAIVVSPQMYTALQTLGRRHTESTLEIFVDSEGVSMRLLGLPVDRDACLAPHDIRFRSEVAL